MKVTLNRFYSSYLDYSDRITLRNVPANKDFVFQVGVYAEDLNAWSQVSDDSKLFRMNIGFYNSKILRK